MPLVPGIGAAANALGGLGGSAGVGGAGGTRGEWSVGSIDGADGTPASGGGSFGSVLGQQLNQLNKIQNDAATASQSLADGTATDPTAVVMSVERARLSMQMAAQLRTKGVDAINDIFHTTV